MTNCGLICLIVLMTAALIGLILCSMRQQRSGRPRGSTPRRKDQGLPTVAGEPVRFRTAELRFVTCKASSDLYGAENLPIRYRKQELAYLLADQLIEQGAIRFSESGTTLRAELRALLPEAGRSDE